MSSPISATTVTATTTLPMTQYVERDRDQLSKELSQTLNFPHELNTIITHYIIDITQFDAHCWRRFFAIDVREQPVLSDKFYTFWFRSDPIDRTKRVYETYLPPVLCPGTKE